MATASSSNSGNPIQGTIVPSAGQSLTYDALVLTGVDLDALVAEYVARNGVDGIRCVVSAVNAAPQQVGTHQAIESLGALEALKSAIWAKQVAQAVAFEDAVIAERVERGTRQNNPSWGTRGEVALALHVSPESGASFMNSSRLLVEDLPSTVGGMRSGLITFEQAMVVVSGVRDLKAENRQLIDVMLWNGQQACFEAGTAMLRHRIHYWALALEPKSAADLEDLATKKRYFNGYQIDDYNVKISGRFPLEQGLPIIKALHLAVDKPRNAEDDRSRAQVAADTAFEVFTGTKTGDSVPVELLLVMNAENLTEDARHPVLVPGYGYLSAAKGLELLAGSPENPLDTWLRNLYAVPETGKLVAMESTGRLFSGQLKKFIKVRDQYCRTPFCNGRIQELDHVVQVSRDGKTTEKNSSGRCKRCNMTKEAPGWKESPIPGAGRHAFEITTPSNHTYISMAPPPMNGNGPQGPPKRL
jgi:hypothetical protein